MVTHILSVCRHSASISPSQNPALYIMSKSFFLVMIGVTLRARQPKIIIFDEEISRKYVHRSALVPTVMRAVGRPLNIDVFLAENR